MVTSGRFFAIRYEIRARVNPQFLETVLKQLRPSYMWLPLLLI
jgi:hypothetical protein